MLLIAVATTAAAQPQGPGPGGRGGQGPLPGGRGGRFGGIPPRDNAQAPTGTAKISGRVIAADTGTPIRRAQININSRDAQFNRSVTTDSEGRYELAALPAGRYRLFVNKAGYVALEYGQARPFEAGKPLDITAGQVLEKIDFSLPRGSAITGRITDEFGDPITDVQVQALRYQFLNGERQLVDAGRTAQTDDLGAYRIFGLMPGDYIIRASARPNMPQGPRGAETEQTGYPGTYYPGVADVSQAQTVTAALGQELSSIGFPLVPARLSRISGTVMGSDGRPLAGAMVMIRARGGAGMGPLRMNIIGNAGGQVRPDGSFQLTNVPPGEYVLDVQQRPQNIRNLQDLNLSQLEFASMPLSVSGGDIDNLTVMTTPGVTVSGRVAYQGQGAPKSTLQVTAAPPSGGAAPIGQLINARALGGGRVNQDGTFELRGVAGPQMIRVQSLPVGWGAEEHHARWSRHHRCAVRLQARQQRDRPGHHPDRSTERDHRQRTRWPRRAGRRLRARRLSREYETLGRAVALRADDAAKPERHLQHQGAASRTLSGRGRSRSRKRFTERSRCARTASPARAQLFAGRRSNAESESRNAGAVSVIALAPSQ